MPCAPVNRIDQVFGDPQVQARGMRIELPHPTAGHVPGVANPVRFSVTPVDHGHAAPELGQHTEAVLADLLGLDAEELLALHGDGVIAIPPANHKKASTTDGALSPASQATPE